ncbi:hypothetical protein BU15DRAFT_66896 [Melanogaster broomeanus]|nr:hypothetical protein BU15DRAFT_66896 [Melanogaster broomeanus]
MIGRSAKRLGATKANTLDKTKMKRLQAIVVDESVSENWWYVEEEHTRRTSQSGEERGKTCNASQSASCRSLIRAIRDREHTEVALKGSKPIEVQLRGTKPRRLDRGRSKRASVDVTGNQKGGDGQRLLSEGTKPPMPRQRMLQAFPCNLWLIEVVWCGDGDGDGDGGGVEMKWWRPLAVEDLVEMSITDAGISFRNCCVVVRVPKPLNLWRAWCPYDHAVDFKW